MGSTKIAAPTAPTPESEVNAWVSALPKVYQAQMDYQLPMAQAQKSAMESLYPTTAGLQENLAGQATQGMQSGVPQYMQDQWQSNMNAQLGSNAGSPIGADYMSRGLMQQQQEWKNYYSQMAMSLAGRQPLAQPSLDYMTGFTPNQVMGNMSNIYGTQANVFATQQDRANSNAQLYQGYAKMGLNGIGSMMM